MRTRPPLITSSFILLACVAGLTGLAQRTDARQTGTSSTTPGANTEPLILVVHGVGSSLFGGSGNRPDGWSDDIAKEWGVPVHEITFRYPGRTLPQSYTDFAYTAGDWAVSVQNQIQAAIKANPGRRVMIVSHSWGTVAAKIALMGGVTRDGDVPPIQGVSVDDWVTLGSPLGRSDAQVSGNLQQLAARGRSRCF